MTFLAKLLPFLTFVVTLVQPPPPPKQETKWEKFAKAKGISLNKEKRSRKVFDEATQTWMYRHGYEKANKKDKEWPIMEVGANDDPYQDPWEKLREAKKARVDKNVASRLKNEERAGNLAKGATNRVMKGKEKAYQAGKENGRMDRHTNDTNNKKSNNTLPTGVPVDLKDGNSAAESKLRGKTSTIAALTAVQRSTASLGKFDKMRDGEPERKKTLTKMKKRKYESATDKKVLSTEGDKSMKILNSVMNGGGVAKEKAIRKGQLARGETAYDYVYDDGLGASSFRKKKGRGGAGKMKKMTKKRMK
jgi:regulator of ribosome biosynthesis